MKTLKYILFSAFLLVTSIIVAQELPEPMSPPRLVNDFAGLLSQDEQSILETKLYNYFDSTSTQIYIVVVPDLQGYDKSDYAFKLGDKWKIGIKGKNNGVLILIKPKISNERGEVFIATGYGMEAIIPDITANKYIVNRDILPAFKQNRYYEGLDAATTTIMGLASGKFTADQYNKRKGSSGGAGAVIFIIIIIVLVLIFKGNSRNRGNTMGGSSLPFWLALGMMSSGSRSSGGFGGFSSGSGGFGGFGGGGGGSFGGGGAGGSW